MYDKLHKRPSDLNQQPSKAVRPPLPRDGSRDGQNNVNKMPAGYISTWDFGNGEQTKYSATTGGGKKVY